MARQWLTLKQESSMAKKDTAEDNGKEKKSQVEKDVADIKVGLRRVMKAVEVLKEIGMLPKDGFAKLGVLVVIVATFMAASVMAEDYFIIYKNDAVHGNFYVTSDGAGKSTLTVDAIAATTTSYGNLVTFSAGLRLAANQDITVQTDNTSDLGASGTEFKDGFFDGTLTTDLLAVDETATFTGVATFTAKPVLNGGADINEEVDVDFNATDEEFYIDTSDGGTYVVKVHNSDADVTSQSTLLALTYADDGQANADFITCLDNSAGDAKFTVGQDGDTAIVGTLALTGVGTFTAQPVFNAGVDVNEDVDIDFNATDEEFSLATSDGATYVVQIHNSDANITAQSTLLALTLVDDGDVDGDFITCLDNSSADAKFTVGNDGNTVIAGTLGVTGVATMTAQTVFSAGIDVNEDVDIDFDANDEEVNIDQATNSYAAGGSVVRIYSAEDANGDNQQYQLRLAYKNDGGANNEFIVCQDNSTGAAANGDAKFTVGEEGNTIIAGTLTVSGKTDITGIDVAVAEKTANYTNLVTDCVLSYSTAGGAFTNTLPDASTVLGQTYMMVLDTAGADLDIDTVGADTFDGTNTRATMNAAADSIGITATSANRWSIWAQHSVTLSTQL